MFYCQYCKRSLINKGAVGSHEPYCKQNPTRKFQKRSPMAGLKKGSLPWNKGLSLLITHPNTHEEIREKMIKNHRGGGLASTNEAELNRRTKIQKSINNRYAAGWHPVCGRAKKYHYDSCIAGHVILDGSWELAVAKYLDNNNLIWRRPTERFTYTKENGNVSTYLPDFWVDEWNSYLEVKGYKTSIDDAKWNQFKKPLIIWFKKDLIVNGILGE